MMLKLLLFSTALMVAPPVLSDTQTSGDCMKTTATLSVNYNDSADTSADLFGRKQAYEGRVDGMANKVKKDAMTLTSMNYNVRMNANNNSQKKYTISGNYNYTVNSEPLARKMFDHLSDDGIKVNMRVNKNQDRNCMNQRKRSK